MIYYPKIYGVCQGANKAIKMAYKLKEEFKDKNIYIFKEVLHNQYVIDDLNKNGIKIVDDLDKVNKDNILIIRAHGEAKEVFEHLKKRNINYYDATCINVERVHKIVENKYKDYKIIIVGKKNHPEVIGTNGWCENNAIIIENEEDYNKLNHNDNYYIVCQTTISYDTVNKLLKYMDKNKFTYTFENTICNNQKLIQTSSIKLAKDMDVMFVIGGKNSSNTKELFNECKKVCKSYFFSTIEEFYDFIKTQKYTSKTKIGFTGGASTSKNQIYEFAYLLEFFIYYKDNKKKIEKEITKFNKELKLNNNDIIDDAINKFKYMNFDGKCIRGTLINLGYKLHKNDLKSLPLAASYEAFETSILIHDDIIDNSNLRRNKPTIHEIYKQDFNNYKLDNTPTSLALCIGDLGFYYTYEYIVKHYKNDKNLSKLLSYFNNIVIDTIKGEILDVYLPFIEKNDKKHKLLEEDIMQIYKLKTSKYTIVGPFILGMILSNSNQKEISKMEEILEPLGIAFQIKDDILGIFSKKEILGKSVYSDIEEFKQTILYSYIKIEKPEYLDRLLKYYGKQNITDKDHKEIQNILEQSGSLEYANNKMNELFEYSKKHIYHLDINQEVKNILLGLINYLNLRKK